MEASLGQRRHGEFQVSMVAMRKNEVATVSTQWSTKGEKDAISKKAKEQFQTIVVSWFNHNSREFPWRTTSNPFHILIAEVLLRQTQAYRVVEHYKEFIAGYPTPGALAQVKSSELVEWFRPLGLVRRADRLIEASGLIVHQHGGYVPSDLDALMSLPGIGEYSARAVLCLAFGAAVPMVDEGSGRLLRRVWGLPKKGPAYNDRSLLGFAKQLIPRNQSREFNLGLLDIASAYCHVRKPICEACPVAGICTYWTPIAGGDAK